MDQKALDDLKHELSVKAKNGLDFISAAAIIWIGIGWVWTLSFSSYNKSVFTFIIGGFMLPLAWLFSKLLKTQWKVEDNPLQPLGLWLNFAQLFYFPFLVFMLLKHPDYFVMAYVIITGAHFFPYAWYYDEMGYAAAAALMSIGGLIVGLMLAPAKMYVLAWLMALALILLAVWLFMSYQKRKTRTA